MPNISVPILTVCDATHEREGLLGILGGGITVINRESYPAPLAADIAAQLQLTDVSAGDSISVTLSITHADGEPVEIEDLDFKASFDNSAELLSLPLTINARDMKIPRSGKYKISISSADGPLSAVDFIALEVQPATDEMAPEAQHS
jgi:hypothetical protein